MANEAATIPLGATKARKNRSRKPKSLRRVARATNKGRPTKTTIATTIKPFGHKPAMLSISMLAARRT